MKYNTAINTLKNLLIITGCTASLYGCGDTSTTDSNRAKMNNINIEVNASTRQAIRKIKERRIVFAHHSVGGNILNGLQEIAKQAGIQIAISNINNATPSNQYTLLDFSPGKNTFPKTKVDDFVSQIEKLTPEYAADIAVMKFCYVDFLKETDVDEVFNHYKKNLEILKKKRSDITFVHFTAPLMARSYDFKARLKRLVGLDHWIDTTNVKRAKYNELLLTTFINDPIFDIAKIESTRLDGVREEFIFHGKKYHSMVPEYTYDGGHLNKLGEYVVAKEFVHFLADVAK